MAAGTLKEAGPGRVLSTLRGMFDGGIATLHPAYFALVMATGILGTACHLLRIPLLPRLLLWINLPAYVLLWLFTILRFSFHRQAFLKDWSDHGRGPGFFTTVAATSVVGVQLAVLQVTTLVPACLWWLALGLWVLCIYGVFAALMVKEPKPDLASGINGGWLSAVVATQSLAVLGTLAGPWLGVNVELLDLLLISFWLMGGMLYIWMISLIFYRYTFFRFQPTDLLPPYWINMGAMAISTLAGALLIRRAGSSVLLGSLVPFLKGFTLFYWATATWWIPMLGILGIWRYVAHRIALTYDPLYWGAVFPMAMYTTATWRLAEALNLRVLYAVPKAFIALALTSWMLTFFGLLLGFIRALLLAFRGSGIRPGSSSLHALPFQP
ncbi:C4-dicarboxylate transporter [Geothrix limicola]|uniref:C4-dicarboxylate transporter n=1 Tax=Geothrix limicola TaxID=2927978 RepID=A0ABQ5QDK6_9BACT|nr:tellurite resistance/C4-dicarboxylate transporter family protein [Geothrix limicola]GLH72747.1 C4-dicarboxylate transporter [Geothrix limicola]